MESQFKHLKTKAIRLRKKGASLRDIETSLKIPKSTLYGWVKDVQLTQVQKENLDKNWRNALSRARVEAVRWHNAQKQKRLSEAKQSAEKSLLAVNSSNTEIIELALAMLYLGEGFKKQNLGMGNSDPDILIFFIFALEKVYTLNRIDFRYDLHLRADQNPDDMKRFWSNKLNVPLKRFKYVAFDKRTIGKTTYFDYKGVCLINCGNVAIQRKLVYLGKAFCNIQKRGYAVLVVK